MDRRTPIACVLAIFFSVLCVTGLRAQVPPPAKAAPPTEQGLLAKGAKRLTGDDFKTRYVGSTLTGNTADGEPFHVFVESLTAYRMLFQGKRSADRWSVGKDGEFCATAGSETSCTREYLHEQTIVSFNPDGTLAGTARIRPGNPEKL